MEIAYLIFIFLAPGLAIGMYKRKYIISSAAKADGTVYEKLFEAVVHSVIITAGTIAVIKLIHVVTGAQFPQDIECFIWELGNFKQLVAYIVVCTIITIIWYCIYQNIISPKTFEEYKKKMQDEKGMIPTNENGFTVWENIFLTKRESQMRKIASIFKDGNYITSGEIVKWNMGIDEKRELRIYNSHIIEGILKADKEKKVSERLLYNVEYEYYDVENGTLIRFYDPAKLDEHWDEL